jgi:hypothetical protein
MAANARGSAPGACAAQIGRQCAGGDPRPLLYVHQRGLDLRHLHVRQTQGEGRARHHEQEQRRNERFDERKTVHGLTSPSS